ncbi:MAG: serine hydrolase [Pirellulales bacterium]
MRTCPRAPWFCPAPFVLGIALVVLVASPARTVRAAEPLAGLDDYLTKAIADWKVPGLAIAIVKDDALVHAKGYGVRKLGESTPVDERSLFAIGSTSKAFTAACLAILADEGKLKWDDPATKYLPSFELYDPYATRELTVRDLVCHRCGLSRGDALWYATAYDRAEVLRRLRYLKPSWSFRSRYGYQNIMFLAAGEIVPAVTGQSWDEFVKQRIFLPLGMNSACTSVKELASNSNVATPHVELEGTLEPVAWRNIDNVGPAGSINASVADMAQWLRLQLGQGLLDGKRIVSAAAIDEMQSPQTVVRLEDVTQRFYPDAHLMAYGLGWFLHDYRGRKVVEHGGAIDGMRAQVALVPEEKLGVVILCNKGGSGLPGPLMFHVIDCYLGKTERDWSSEALAKVRELEAKGKEEESKRDAKRVKDTRPSLPLEKYAGKYSQDLYGDSSVALENGNLVLTRGPAVVADLEHWHYDTFRAKFRDRVIDKELVTFRLDAAGQVHALDFGELGTFARQE